MPIQLLRPEVSSKIAAGEVIERPASAVKELVENALDAGASRIRIEIRGGGIEYIRITDDGSGIRADQVELAFKRFATSKLEIADDLDAVSTLGFRGEALPSIASVARIDLRTRTPDSDSRHQHRDRQWRGRVGRTDGGPAGHYDHSQAAIPQPARATQVPELDQRRADTDSQGRRALRDGVPGGGIRSESGPRPIVLTSPGSGELTGRGVCGAWPPGRRGPCWRSCPGGVRRDDHRGHRADRAAVAGQGQPQLHQPVREQAVGEEPVALVRHRAGVPRVHGRTQISSRGVERQCAIPGSGRECPSREGRDTVQAGEQRVQRCAEGSPQDARRARADTGGESPGELQSTRT